MKTQNSKTENGVAQQNGNGCCGFESQNSCCTPNSKNNEGSNCECTCTCSCTSC